MAMRIEQLNIPDIGQPPDPTTLQAAELLNAEVLDSDLPKFLHHLRSPIVQGYALLDDKKYLLGATTIELTPEYTHIASIQGNRDWESTCCAVRRHPRAGLLPEAWLQTRSHYERTNR